MLGGAARRAATSRATRIRPKNFYRPGERICCKLMAK